MVDPLAVLPASHVRFTAAAGNAPRQLDRTQSQAKVEDVGEIARDLDRFITDLDGLCEDMDTIVVVSWLAVGD